jgi:hypothetical protein
VTVFPADPTTRPAGGELELRVELETGSLLVEVHDQSTEIPTLFDAGSQDENHRGILIIDEVSVDWGYTITADGKCVYAEFTPNDLCW